MKPDRTLTTPIMMPTVRPIKLPLLLLGLRINSLHKEASQKHDPSIEGKQYLNLFCIMVPVLGTGLSLMALMAEMVGPKVLRTQQVPFTVQMKCISR